MYLVSLSDVTVSPFRLLPLVTILSVTSALQHDFQFKVVVVTNMRECD